MNMIPKQAIEKAIEGGYWDKVRSDLNQHQIFLPTAKETQAYRDIVHKYHQTVIALDPTFWQALGRVFLWSDGAAHVTDPTPEWKEQAHRFYDLILARGDTEAFWDELLN